MDRKNIIKIMVIGLGLFALIAWLSMTASNLKNQKAPNPTPPPEPEKTLTLPLQKIGEGHHLFMLHFTLPEDYGFAEDVASEIKWRSSDETILKLDGEGIKIELAGAPLPLAIRAETSKGSAKMTLDAKIYYCDKATKVCYMEYLRVIQPVQAEGGTVGMSQVHIPIEAKNPKRD